MVYRILYAISIQQGCGGGVRWRKMTSLPLLRTIYATLLQMEYVLALVTGVLLGAEKWTLFIVCLALTCGLGFVTTVLYWHLMDLTTKGQ